MPEFIYEVCFPTCSLFMTEECLKKCAEFMNEHGLPTMTVDTPDYRFDTLEGVSAYLQDLAIPVRTHMLTSDFSQLYDISELGVSYNVK